MDLLRLGKRLPGRLTFVIDGLERVCYPRVARAVRVCCQMQQTPCPDNESMHRG
jgi:hypothetical protein